MIKRLLCWLRGHDWAMQTISAATLDTTRYGKRCGNISKIVWWKGWNQ
jgi:hypothetical protein